MKFMFSIKGITYEYAPFHCVYAFEGSEPIPFYGIRLLRHSKTSYILAEIPRITTKEDTIQRLVCILSHAKVSPHHFKDVVEDFVAAL